MYSRSVRICNPSIISSAKFRFLPFVCFDLVNRFGHTLVNEACIAISSTDIADLNNEYALIDIESQRASLKDVCVCVRELSMHYPCTDANRNLLEKY